MKILVVDRLLKGKPHSDWKEGWALYYAGLDLGYNIDIAGLDCPISEQEIPSIANEYDLIIVTENYPNAPQLDGKKWGWWNWKEIKTPKLFWAIDTHFINYKKFIHENKFDYVAFNNPSDIKKHSSNIPWGFKPKLFFLPLAVRKDLYDKNYSDSKEFDVTFIGSLNTEERKKMVNKFNILSLNAFGTDYIKQLQKSKISFNYTMSYDLNAKFFEITGSGSFLLSNLPNKFILDLFDFEIFGNCIWKNENDLMAKINFFLKYEDIRESIAAAMRINTLENHTYNNRIKKIIEII
jgi:spore maturation protein CgeB